MAALVKVVVGPYVMPNGGTYTTGQIVALTDAQRSSLPSGDFSGGTPLLDVTVNAGTAGATGVSSVDGQVGVVDLSTRYGKIGEPSQARGQLVLILDDCKISHYTIALPALEAVGGKCTFAVNSDVIGLNANQMNAAQLLDSHNRGHEIAAHSKTHTTMTGLTAAQRVTEWDTPRTVIEGIIGAGTVKTFVYPGNSHSGIDPEGYLRYDRLFTGQSHGPPVSRQQGDRHGFVYGRRSWIGSPTGHALTLSWIRAAATQTRTLALYTHQVDGSDLSIGVTQAQFQELVDLATSLGMRFVTAAQGLPSHPNTAYDFGFEDSTLVAWTLTVSGSSTVASIVDTPDVGIYGTRSLQIVGDGSGSNIAESMNIPIEYPQEEYTFGGRVRCDALTAGNFYIQVEEMNSNGSLVTSTNTGAVSAVGAWRTLSGTFTPSATTRTVLLRCVGSAGFIGTAVYDHMVVGPTRLGVLV